MLAARTMPGERGSGRTAGGPDEPSEFGMLLRQYRVAASLTQAALAEKSGLSVRGIADLERGARRFPHVHTIARLASALELSPSHLTAGTNTRRRSPGRVSPPSDADNADNAVLSQRSIVPFVGRDGEMEQLRDAFHAAVAGRGRTGMVVGEPGIGKTALCERFAALVSEEGGLPLVGHCFEEGSLSLPYLPFLEVLRAYMRTTNPANLRRDLGSAASDLARLLPELCELFDLRLRPAGDPREDRWRLLSAVSDFLRAAATRKPLVLILEDLHDADHATLDLLMHLARTLQSGRVLMVGTYRDIEVDRAHPLSSALADLRRIAPVLRLALRGLSAEDVQVLVERMSFPGATPQLARAIQHQTEGNPLFVHEVTRYLSEQSGAGGPSAMLAHVPEGLRDVIGKRLSGLSGPTNRLLGTAAVIGRDFRLDVVGQLATMMDDDLYIALEEAVAGGVLEDSSVGATASYRFKHALFRQALYEELIAPRRIRLHQQVARALEQVHARHTQEHAAELAEHFAFCSEPEDLAKAVSYGQAAARHAMDVFAYGEAARLLKRALQVQDVLDPEDIRRCDLLLQLGEAMLPMEQPGQVARIVAGEAFNRATNSADRRRAFGACILALRALWRDAGNTSGFASQEVRGWLERAEIAADASSERIHVDCYWGQYHIDAGDPARGQDYLRDALHRAQALGDTDVYVVAASFAVGLLQTVDDQALVEQLALDLYARQLWMRLATDRTVLAYLAVGFFGRGDRERGTQILRQLWDLAQTTNDLTVTIVGRFLSAWQALLDGRLEEAARLGSSADEEAERTGARLASSASLARAISARALFYMGRTTELDLNVFGSTRSSLAKKAGVLAFLGRCQEVAAIRERFGAIGDIHDQTSCYILGDLLEACTRCRDRTTAEQLVARLSPLANRLQPLQVVSYGRLLGDASVLLERPDDARAYYQQALEVSRAARCLPELALTQLALADLLLMRGSSTEQTQALALLDAAIAAFGEMHMQPSLERALSLANSARERRQPTHAARGLPRNGSVLNSSGS